LTLATQGAVQAVPISPVPISPNQFLFRSDVKSYYASIDHAVLLTLVRDRIDNWRVLDLVAQYLGRTIDENCLYATVTRGISLGCPLSPVMAALYLEPLDRRLEATGLTYARFMDDWVILAPRGGVFGGRFGSSTRRSGNCVWSNIRARPSWGGLIGDSHSSDTGLPRKA
jgi:retron-type reverse transcriptase